jgi:hypothetical protein
MIDIAPNRDGVPIITMRHYEAIVSGVAVLDG